MGKYVKKQTVNMYGFRSLVVILFFQAYGNILTPMESMSRDHLTLLKKTEYALIVPMMLKCHWLIMSISTCVEGIIINIWYWEINYNIVPILSL